MNRKEWHQYLNPQTHHIIYSLLDPSEMTICEAGSYYQESGRVPHMTRKERKSLHHYACPHFGIIAISKIPYLELNFDLFDEDGEFYLYFPLNMVK